MIHGLTHQSKYLIFEETPSMEFIFGGYDGNNKVCLTKKITYFLNFRFMGVDRNYE
ncbi:hypothetical protein K0M31_007827 [Melipona bicolor]|uniref:Uncharacterized protein n=1 Tax=Melipona bicolor TaxID=60889 RepID=A0AA40GCF2_9HYME|nr:hypothetical protein K0M31_007827 [Melipona bicolor]